MQERRPVDWLSENASNVESRPGVPAPWFYAMKRENRPDSGNNNGTEAVARASPDGYTLCQLLTGPSPDPRLFHLSYRRG
jgi:hypothetical protein